MPPKAFGWRYSSPGEHESHKLMNHYSVADRCHLAFGLDEPLPQELYLGMGTALLVRGWCYSQDGLVRGLKISVGAIVVSASNHSWGRTDVFVQQCPSQDQSGNSLLSGFECVLSFPAETAGHEEEVTLHVTLDNGATVERPLGRIRLYAGYLAQPTSVRWPGAGPKVAICMATYKPPIDLFAAQVASLQAQTHTNWVCIVSDDNTPNEDWDRARRVIGQDERFILFIGHKRLNFYENFQAALTRVPDDADFIALCDQDDVWRPDKLATLLGAFGDDTQLVFSDARVVDAQGTVLSDTFWSTRRNNYTNLPALMVANTITGAASMFPASLLPELLPFPQPIGDAYHDQWIGLVALAKGRIGYVDRPLYDYVQHAVGVIGHKYLRGIGLTAAVAGVVRAGPRPGNMARMAAMLLKQASDYHALVMQKSVLSRTLLMRFPGLPAGKRTALERFTDFDTSMRATLRAKTAAVLRPRGTLNMEGTLLWAQIGARLRNAALRRKQSQLLRLQSANPGGPLLGAIGQAGTAPAAAAKDANVMPVLEYGDTKWLHHNISPLTLDVSPRFPKRVNLLLATINFNYVFGGYIGMFNLALRLKRQGYRTRIILHEATEWDPGIWRAKIQKYPGLEKLFDEVEVISRADRTVPVEVNPEDRFVATNCWAAHIAHHSAKHLTERRFLVHGAGI